MNTNRIAIFIARFGSVQFIFLALLYLTYMPQYIFTINNSRSVAGAEYARLELRMTLLRIVLHLLLGAALYFFARPIANALSPSVAEPEDVS